MRPSHRPFRSTWQRVFAVLCALLLAFVAVPAFADQPELPADAPAVPARVDLPELPAGYQTTDLGWLHLSYPPELEKWAEPMAETAREFRSAAEQRLGQSVLANVHVRLAEDPAAMTELAPRNAPYPKYAAGVAYSALGLVLLTEEPVNPADAHDLLTTFRHELAHVALHDAIAGERVPRWFNEGLAIHLSGENTFARMRALWTASLSGNVIPLPELERRFPNDPVGVPLAYAQSADVVRYLLRSQDQERFRQLVSRVRRGQTFDRAVYDSYGLDTYNLEREWLDGLDSRFSFLPALLSGTVIWTFAVVLITLAWRRKRQRQVVTLRRWAREEALEDARVRLLLQRSPSAKSSGGGQPGLVRVITPPVPAPEPEVQRSDALAKPDAEERDLMDQLGPHVADAPGSGGRRDTPLPRVEHDGAWHTLH